jgi:choline dehydrogenase-like flavoprotein
VIQDLSTNNPGNVEADALVIGAGTVGLILAARLSERGHNVVVLETGGRHQLEDTNPLNEVILQGQAYQGAEHGRFRCLGGTSTRWGGAMLPFLPDDFSASFGASKLSWGSVDYIEPMSYLPELEKLFGLPDDDYRVFDAPVLSDFEPRFAKWPAFKYRNTATLFKDKLEASDGPRVWLNAHVTEIELSPSGRLTKVIAQAPGDKRLTVSAKTVVLAAGAIESTRLLLLLDASHDYKIFAPYDVLGRYFYDHLAMPVADVIPKNISAFGELVGYRYQGPVMRSLRYELSSGARKNQNLPATYLHIASIADDDSGFAALRDVFRKIQRRSLPNFDDIRRIGIEPSWLARATWCRYAKGRLLSPTNAKFELNQVIEQIPDANNRISLSAEHTDPYGQPLAIIDWRVREGDLQNFERLFELYLQNWRSSSLASVADIVERPRSETIKGLTSEGGIYHPGGSVRIGTGASDGVVDGDLKVFKIPNLRVVSTAVFPNGGTANPTQMLLLFGLRAVDQIHVELQSYANPNLDR